MYTVIQNYFNRSRTSVYTRSWQYKTEVGAKRRVWLCKQSKSNSLAYYITRDQYNLFVNEKKLNLLGPLYASPKFWQMLDEFVHSEEYKNDK